MEKVNGMPLYWLGVAIGQLYLQLARPLKVVELINPANYVRNNLNSFLSSPQYFPLSSDAAKNVVSSIDSILNPERLKNQDAVISQEELNILGLSLFNFQAVLGTELPRTNVFYATSKRAYDMTILINQGENVLSQEIIKLLGLSKTEIVNDIRESTKCLAFDIPTAIGFYIYRAVETIITKNYFPILNILSCQWEKNKNLGHYITLLEGALVDQKVTTILRHLKDNYRNPISHPEEFWDLDKAESAFSLAISVITVMVQDIQTKTEIPQGDKT